MLAFALTLSSFTALAVLTIVYYFLITEKLPKAVVAVLGGITLIILQIFRSSEHSSQDNAFHFISNNLDILGFVIGMMVLVGIVRQSGIFEAAAIWLVKAVRGQPSFIVGFGCCFIYDGFVFNIPTVLILTPVLLV
jgi:Na+/H+ antiporter NhaD/arsenite permease-like protein